MNESFSIDLIPYCPEVELLLCCARTQLDAFTAERMRALVQQEINWCYVSTMAARNHIQSICYRSLQSICPNEVPSRVLEDLKQASLSTALTNLFLTRQLVQLLDHLAQH